jgi:hypothetical protein
MQRSIETKFVADALLLVVLVDALLLITSCGPPG